MIYQDYEKAYDQYIKAQEWFEQALQEQERLITRTLPRAIRYDKQQAQRSDDVNPLDDYVIEKEEKRIDKKIARSRKLLEARLKILEMKEKDLRKSQHHLDKIYVLYHLEGHTPSQVANALNYSMAQVYRYINKLKKDEKK